MRQSTLAYGPFDVTTWGGGFSVLVRHRETGREAYVQGDDAVELADSLDALPSDHCREILMDLFDA